MPHGVLDLVAHVLARTDSKHLIQLFKGKCLGLGDKEEDEEPKNGTPSCVPPKCTLRCEGSPEGWPGEGQNEVEAPSCCGSPRHTHITDMDWERLCRVCERHRAFSRRIKDLEEIHAGCNHTDSLLYVAIVVRDEERHPCPQQEDAEERKSEEQKVSATPPINGEDGGNGEYKIENTGTHRRKQSRVGRVARVYKDGGAVVSDDIDCVIR